MFQVQGIDYASEFEHRTLNLELSAKRLERKLFPQLFEIGFDQFDTQT
jgi:hypothetical protein